MRSAAWAMRASVYRGAAGPSSSEPKLPWPSIEGQPQRERLGHADEGVVDRRVAVRVVLAHHLADDALALHVRAVGSQAHLVGIP